MPDDLRITADELKQRMQAGEQFTIIDTRNPQAWAEATDMAPGAIRFHGNDLNQILPKIPPNEPVVTYCT
jgi:rhodanese-related sulfurtransferase